MLKAQYMAHMHLQAQAHQEAQYMAHIQLGFIQDGTNPLGLLTLFTWAKDVKI